MKCPRCQQDNRPAAKFCDECGTPLGGTSPEKPYAELKDENEVLGRSLSEALQQQTASSDILRATSEAQSDAQPVFDAIARSTVRLCEASRSTVWRQEGGVFRAVARCEKTPGGHILHAPSGEVLEGDSLPSRAICERQILRINDVREDLTVPPKYRERARIRGYRSFMAVPMVCNGRAVGAITVVRSASVEFSDQQVYLVKTFADQAVIAIENVRLFTELQARNDELTRALDRETASSEILRVISSSPTDVQPVFDTIVRNAVRLCGASHGGVYRVEGDFVHSVAHHGFTSEQLQRWQATWPKHVATTPSAACQAIRIRSAVRFGDLETAPELRGVSDDVRANLRERGTQSAMAVPMLRRGEVIGAISLAHRELNGFSEAHLQLLKTFADQAVIAIENVRLFKELEARNAALTESLEQQTGTSEILRVISSSPTNVQPVFDAIIRNAVTLCGALYGLIWRYEQEIVDLAGAHNIPPAELEELRSQFPRPIEDAFAHALVRSGSVVNIADIEVDENVRDWPVRERWRARGVRSVVIVPLRREAEVVGAIGVSHREVSAFSASRIDLLKTFADQAIIAIENVRLFTELQARNRELTEALDQQTATSEILRVISSSPTDIEPVFDAIVRSAVALCDGIRGLAVRLKAGQLHVAGRFNVAAEMAGRLDYAFPRAPAREYPVGRAIVDGAIVHFFAEAGLIQEFPAIAAPELGRSVLAVPLLRDGKPIGAIGITGEHATPFTDRQIALLQTFSDQAVIAIENVRLFTELQEKNRALTEAHAQVTEALDQQTATSEILRVISTSPNDIDPVLDTVARNAARLCDALDATIFRVDGNMLRRETHHGPLPDVDTVGESGLAIIPGNLNGVAVMERRTVQVADLQSETQRFPSGSAWARRLGFRTIISVPLLKDGAAIGVIAVRRADVRPFTDAQIALLETFADQAVIAIENVRLFTELQARNHELTATSEILRVIARSPTNVQPVFDTIVRSALRLCDAKGCVAYRYDGKQLYVVAHTNLTPEVLASLNTRYPQPPSRETVTGISTLERRVVHIPDADANDLPPASREFARQQGWGSMLAVPLLRDGQPVGNIALSRVERGPFSDQQIAIVQTFADQAVIAIENVRLFTELQTRNQQLTEALDQQTATGDILKVISRSHIDVQPVFDVIAESALRLSDAKHGNVLLFDGALVHLAAFANVDAESSEVVRSAFPRPPDRASASTRAILTRRVVEIADVLEDPEYQLADVARRTEFRSSLSVPLLRDREAIGAITVTRTQAGHFSEKVIALLQTFADQAVIAIENVRLFRELQARTEQLMGSVEHLTALGEVGRAVSSTLDLETVLTTIVSRAVGLSGLDGGVVFEYDESAEEFVHRAATETGGALAEVRRATRVRKAEGVVGQTAITLEPIQVHDITVPGAHEGRLRENLIESGIRAVLAVPMVYDHRLIGCLVVSRNQPGEFSAEAIELLRTFATQSALAIQNARLFREIEHKSRELEAASRHKSEFLANMSHELRTPLNAIIGFSEVLSERMFGELNEKQDEYLKDIHASGQHLLSLINDILDLSKIEAGKMELERSEFDLPATIDNALMLVRERATRRSIDLQRTVEDRVGQVQADERKIRQVLLNLLSNAIKFTPEGGRIEVRAVPVEGFVEVSVSDTGVGIAPEDQDAIFEEFKQVGMASKKVEGTGLGLALSRKFVELHGGRIWVKSQIGQGATFTFTIPVRRGE